MSIFSSKDPGKKIADLNSAQPHEWGNDFKRIRSKIHEQFLQNIEQNSIDGAPDNLSTKKQLDIAIEKVSKTLDLELTNSEILQIHKTIIDEIRGLGPLAILMADPQISDILVNGPQDVWIDKNGKLQKSKIQFDDHEHVRRVLDRLVSVSGKHLDIGSPSVDAKLPDGSRLHALIPPLCAAGPIISIRRFRQDILDFNTLVSQNFLNDAMQTFLINAVHARMNIVIAGGAGAGKTTLLKILASHIPDDERVIAIEETAEMNIQHCHVISLETRTVNTEMRGNISLRDLVRNALRMRADRIIVGEVRGEEVLDMLQAMNVGHDGSLTTVHANSASEVVMRLETLALLSSANIPKAAITSMIVAAVDLIIHVARFGDGKRRITSITELVLIDEKPQLRELFRFKADTQSIKKITGSHIRLAEPLSKKIKRDEYQAQ